jgi:hypothetical protein
MAPAPSATAAAPAAAPHVVRPPARRARVAALALSAIAVLFSLGFGFSLRRALSHVETDAYLPWLVYALSSLAVALFLRMVAAIFELLWLERTWSNLPADLRTVGPVENVTSVMVVGLSVVPGVAWVWKLGLVLGIVDGFEAVRARVPFRAAVPRRLGMAAVILGWIPGINIYVAPFLWEMFATRIDRVCGELRAAVPSQR